MSLQKGCFGKSKSKQFWAKHARLRRIEQLKAIIHRQWVFCGDADPKRIEELEQLKSTQ